MKIAFLVCLCLQMALPLFASEADSLATAYARLGEYYAYRDADSARYYCRLGLEHADVSRPEPYLSLLNNLADACISSGELDEGRRLLRRALAEAVRLDYDSCFRATVLTSMGVSYRLQEMPDSALLCYDRALSLLQGQEAYGEETHLLASIAVLYANTARLEEAMQYAGRAVQAADRCDDIDMVFYAYTTAGSIQVLRGNYAEAARLIHPVLAKARLQGKPAMELKCMTFLLGMFQRAGQRDSLNFYMRRADEVLARVPAESNEAVGYLETLYMILSDLGRHRESLRIQQRLLDGENRNQLGSVDRLYLYMARNHQALHEYTQAARCYERAYAASDSLHAEEIEAQLSELSVKYETQEKALEIARLSEEKMKQRAENAWWMAMACIFFLLLLFFAAWYLYRSRRIRREEELKLARRYIDGMESERARLAKDLHDGVCNDLLGIGMQMQCRPDTADVLGMLEQVRQEVRNISHELMPPKFKHTTLDEMMEDYLQRFPLDGKTSICFDQQNEGREWADIPEQVAYETYRIMQELLSNIIRHAGAARVAICLRLEPSCLTLCISDDGKNPLAPQAAGHNGIGLDTIRERATALGGKLCADLDGTGQTFRLSVPLSPGKP